MRILFVNSFYYPEVGGGAEMTLHRLASQMAALGHQCAVFTTGDREITETIAGVNVYRFPIDNSFRKLSRDLPGRFSRAVWQLRDRYSALMKKRLEVVAREHNAQIIQFHNLSGLTKAVWEVPDELGLPSIQVLHDLNLLCPNSSMFKHGRSCSTQCLSCRLMRTGYAAASHHINSVVGVSEFILEKFTNEGYFSSATKHVIYNAQDFPAPFSYVDRAKLSFGYIGSLSPAKGVDWLINQFENSMGVLSIAGTGSSKYTEYLKTIAAGKNVVFLGHVNSREFFAHIDVAVVPSLWNEALGNVAIEASALGRPVIVSRRGGLPEIVVNGQSGLHVNPSNPTELGLAMRRLSDDRALLRAMSEAAPRQVEVFKNVNRFVKSYVDVSRGLLGAEFF